MAVMNTMFRSSRPKLSAEQVASFTAEQRRLKAAAAGRRAATAAGEIVAKPRLSPADVRRNER